MSKTNPNGITTFNVKRQSGKTVNCILYATIHRHTYVFIVCPNIRKKHWCEKFAEEFTGGILGNLIVLSVLEYIDFMKTHKYKGVLFERDKCVIFFDDAQETIYNILNEIGAWCDYCMFSLPDNDTLPFDKSKEI